MVCDLFFHFTPASHNIYKDQTDKSAPRLKTTA